MDQTEANKIGNITTTKSLTDATFSGARSCMQRNDLLVEILPEINALCGKSIALAININILIIRFRRRPP
jgi:hypothetical protein